MYVCLAAKVTTGRGVFEHTYLVAPKCDENAKNLDRETAFGLALQKPLTGRVVLERILIADS